MEEAKPTPDPPAQDPNPNLSDTSAASPSQSPPPPVQEADEAAASPPSPQPQPPVPSTGTRPPATEAAKPPVPPLAAPPLPATEAPKSPLPPVAAPSPPPPQAPTAASFPPPKSKKRPLQDGHVQIQDSAYFKIRAVLKDIRPYLLEVLRTADFRSCKGADEVRERLKLLMELYKQMAAEAVITKKPKNEPATQHLPNENGAAQKPQKQLQDVKLTDQPQSDHVFVKPPEKEAIDLEEQSCYIGGSAFGWNFITFPGSKPVFYGRTKEAFRDAQVAL